MNTEEIHARVEAGERLRAYIEGMWPRSSGGLRGFCRKAGITPEALYVWLRGESEPTLGSVGAIASTLGVTRAEVVAAMDGQAPVVRLDPATRQLLAEELERLLSERDSRQRERKPRARADEA